MPARPVAWRGARRQTGHSPGKGAVGSQGERTGQRERGGKTAEPQLLRTPVNSPSTAAILRSGPGAPAALGRDAGLWKRSAIREAHGAGEGGTAHRHAPGRAARPIAPPPGLFEHRRGRGTSRVSKLPRGAHARATLPAAQAQRRAPGPLPARANFLEREKWRALAAPPRFAAPRGPRPLLARESGPEVGAYQVVTARGKAYEEGHTTCISSGREMTLTL